MHGWRAWSAVPFAGIAVPTCRPDVASGMSATFGQRHDVIPRGCWSSAPGPVQTTRTRGPAQCPIVGMVIGLTLALAPAWWAPGAGGKAPAVQAGPLARHRPAPDPVVEKSRVLSEARCMRVELLTSSGCPNATAARRLLVDCLAEVGIDEDSVVERVGRHPSPTVLVDGVDVMGPGTEEAADACRLDLPTRERVLAALRSATPLT